MGKIKKIAITGASGVGKTTLAQFISKEYDLPFISASARDAWPQFGFENHQQALTECLKDPKLGLNYQQCILLNRHMALSKASSFVTDRSPIDNYAYFMLQQGYESEDNNNTFRDLCRVDYKQLDAVIFIQVNNKMTIEDNGRRLVNLSYQRMVDSVIRMVLEEEFESLKPTLYLNTWDFSERVSEVKLFIEELIDMGIIK